MCPPSFCLLLRLDSPLAPCASISDEEEARHDLDTLIFQELTLGTFTPAARCWLESRIAHLFDARGCHAVVLACTELGALRSSGCAGAGVDEGGESGDAGGRGDGGRSEGGSERASGVGREAGMVFDTTRLHADAAVAFMCTAS